MRKKFTPFAFDLFSSSEALTSLGVYSSIILFGFYETTCYLQVHLRLSAVTSRVNRNKLFATAQYVALS